MGRNSVAATLVGWTAGSWKQQIQTHRQLASLHGLTREELETLENDA